MPVLASKSHTAIFDLAVSANMRFIAFASPDEDLVESDTHKSSDVFVYSLLLMVQKAIKGHLFLVSRLMDVIQSTEQISFPL